MIKYKGYLGTIEYSEEDEIFFGEVIGVNAFDELEKLYPNIKVSCDYSEWSGYETRSNICMVSNTESDVMQINYAWL